MYEDGVLVFEDIEEEDFELLTSTFANEMCSWVAFEVYKHYGDRAEHHFIEYPGCHFIINAPKHYVNDKGMEILGVNIYLHPISEKEVLITGVEAGVRDLILSPEEAVNFLCTIFDK